MEETVDHFLIDCKGNDNEYVTYNNELEMDYNIVTSKLRKELKNVSTFFKEEKNFTSLNILFPQIWPYLIGRSRPKFAPNTYFGNCV